MQKTLLKIHSVLFLVCALLIGSSFTINAYDNGTHVTIPFTETTYGYMIDREKYYVPEYFTITEYTSDLIAYINDMHASGGGASSADNNVDPTYPLFIIATTTNTSTETGINRNLYCFSIDDLSNYNFTDTTAGNDITNIMQTLIGTSIPNYLSGSAVTYGTIFDLGYRFYHKTTTTYSGTTYYLYTLARYKSPDTITFNNDLSGQGYIYGNEWENSLAMSFKRYDFMPLNMKDDNNQTVKYESGYVTMQSFFNIQGYSIYELNDVVIKSRNNYNSIEFAITGMNPYIVLCQTVTSWSTPFPTTYTADTTNGFYYKSSTDLAGIANTLTEIKDLLEDFEVQEINNIYQDIQNNYDVDIDLQLNNYLDDFSDNFNTLDFEDTNFNINTNDVEKVGSFKIIFSNMMQTMNQSGIGILYFLPFVLLIIGAII